MGCRLLILGSVTYASKARAVLNDKGIVSKIQKVSRVKSIGGCGYALRVPENSAAAAERFLNLAGIRVMGNTECEAFSV